MSSQPAWDHDENDFVSDEPVLTERSLVLVDVATSHVVNIHEPLSTDEARELTEHIRSAADVLYILIARAHAGRAWEALGYSTFTDYVRDEFDISRSRAYQLLNQAQVVAVIEAASPDGTDVHISEAAARDLKSVIGEVVPDIEQRTAGMDPVEAGEVIEEIVAEHRDKAREKRELSEEDEYERESDAAAVHDDRKGFTEADGDGPGSYTPPPPPPPIYDDHDEIDPALIRRNVQAAYDLYSSLSALKGMPDLQSIIDTIPVERRVQINENLPTARAFLNDFAELWFAQTWQNGNTGTPAPTRNTTPIHSNADNDNEGDDEQFDENDDAF